MLPINTMQPVVRDIVPPYFMEDTDNPASVLFGTNVFNSGLIALDSGKDISYDIVADVSDSPNTFDEGGSVDVLFSIYDTGANYIEQTVSVPVIGGPKYPTPALFDFTAMTEIPSEFTQTNGAWSITENGLQVSGDMPDSPRWNIVLDNDGDSEIQMLFTANVGGMVNGIIVRGDSLSDMFYVFYRDDVVSLTERTGGSTITHKEYSDENLSDLSPISLGASVESKTLSVYVGAEKVLEHTTDSLRYARQFGVISTNEDAYYQKIMVGAVGAITFGSYEVEIEDNTAPTANAGTNQTLAANTPGQLSGSGTATAAGATITGYQWVAPAGITLVGANTANPTFTTPQLNAATTFTFSLVVTDSNGLTSVADTVDVVVEAYSPPVETDSSVLVLNVPTANGQYDVYLHTKGDGKEVVFDGVVTFNNGGATIQLDIDDGILLTGDATPVSNPTEFNSFGIWGVTQ